MAKSGLGIIWDSIERVVNSPRTKNLSIFCFFLAISFGFWVLQKLDDTFEVEYEIPLELVGVPHGVTLTTPLPKKVTVTIRDRGTNLAQYMRNESFRKPIAMNFSVYEKGIDSGTGFIPIKDVAHAVQMRLASSTQIVSVMPDTLNFYFNNGYNRKLPVCINGELKTTAQNYINHITFSPDSITVFAPKSVCDTMQCVYTQVVKMTNLEKTTTKTLSFAKKNGVKYSPNSVQMTVNVDYYTDITVTVPIVGLNFPADKVLRTFPATAKIIYRVGRANAGKVKAADFVVAVTYEDLMANKTNKFRPHLNSTVPEGVSNIRIIPSEVEYLLETQEESTTE